MLKFTAFTSLFLSVVTSASSNYKLEYGAGLLTFRANHYRGSDQSKNWTIPLPYFHYETEKIEAEAGLIQGKFVSTKYFSMKLSIIAGLKVESEENRARQGMPDLDYTVEAGPMFLFHLYKSQNEKNFIDLKIPVRQVMSTDFTYLRRIGFFYIPYLNFTSEAQDWNFKTRIDFSIAYMGATQKYHAHYYDVAPEYATADRPTYRAKAGYNGTQLALILTKRYRKFQFLPFFRYDYLGGTAFTGSPLYKRSSYFLWGMNTSYIF